MKQMVSVMAPSSLIIITADMVLSYADALLFGLLLDVGMMILARMERTEPKSLDRCGVVDLRGKIVVGYSCLLQKLHSLDPQLPDTMENMIVSSYVR